MGAYSSWAAFTLTHHLTVHWAAKICGFEIGDFKSYIILGDDIVINDDKVAIRYKRIMKKLGVEISEAKTHVSKNTYEFAKRWIHRGLEISGIPLKGIINNISKPMVVLGELMNYFERIPASKPKESCLELIGNLYHNYRINKRKFLTFKSTIRLCKDFHFAQRYSAGHITPNEGREYLLGRGISVDLVPNLNLIPLFLKEMFISGTMSIAEDAANSIQNYFDDYKRIYSHIIDIKYNDLMGDPILCGLHNKLDRIGREIRRVCLNEDLNLLDAVTNMRLDDLDQIAAMRRDKAVTYCEMDKLVKKSLREARNLNESNFELNPLGQFPNKDK